MSDKSAASAAFKQVMKQYGGIFLSLIVLCVIFSVTNQRFMSVANFLNILQQVSVIAIAAFGMTWVILLGEIDLSIGSIIAVAGMVGAQCFAFGMSFVPALILTIVSGALLGLANGVLIAKFLHRHGGDHGHLSRHGQPADQWRTGHDHGAKLDCHRHPEFYWHPDRHMGGRRAVPAQPHPVEQDQVRSPYLSHRRQPRGSALLRHQGRSPEDHHLHDFRCDGGHQRRASVLAPVFRTDQCRHEL